MPYKFGKPNEETDLEDFKKRLGKSKLPKRQKAYLVLLYWLGCRRSEPLFLKEGDVERKDDSFFIAITVREGQPYSHLKRGQAGGPSEIPVSAFGMSIFGEIWSKTRKKRRIFPFSDSTGYRALKKLWPRRSPHWLRYNRVTKLRRKVSQGKVTIDDVKSFTGIKRDSTIENYGLKTKAGIHKIAGELD